MNQEIKDRWVSALRSCEYKQGTSTLSTTDRRFCCLGVLCELAVKDGIITKEISSKDDEQTVFYDGNEVYLPNEVVKWAGLTEYNPRIPNEGNKETPLSVFNDGDDFGYFGSIPAHSFNQIADLIEQHL